ncbi:MAG TPA: hypothetical protein VKG44_11560, partial [Candidatus Baltobacteraceae bacterium]|nr:hypothetical protein [Candidatus Baltobacteraceae bacterium]
MLRPLVGTLALLAGFAGMFAGPVFAQTAAPFNLPAPWSRTGNDPPPPDATRKMTQWHIVGEKDTFTLVDDSAAVYADSIATIEKNFADNKV